MRTWTFLSLLGTVAVFAWAQDPLQEIDSDLHIRDVLRTWHPRNPMNIIDPEPSRFQKHEADEEIVHRSKRSAAQSFHSLLPVAPMNNIPVSKACQTPGYTGEFCEFPICAYNNPSVPDTPITSGVGASIDGAQLANCTQQYVILIDDTLTNIRIDIETEFAQNPFFYLVGENGNQYYPDDVLTESKQQYDAFWSYLPPGQYVVTPSADTGTEYCNLIVRAWTSMTVVGGLIQGDNFQTERSDYPSPLTYVGKQATVVFHANRNRSPGKVVAVNFVGPTNTIFRPRLVNTRYNCSYEYFYESFFCTTAGDYYWQVEGTTFAGWGYRRIVPFKCYNPPPTQSTVTPPSTTVSPVTGCQNNGIMVKNLDGSTYCYCTGLYSGASCQNIICTNGGTVRSDNSCQCPIGFYGDHCQDVNCNDNQGSGFDPNHPTVTFVIRARSQLAGAVNQIMNATSQIVGEIAFDEGYLGQFVLVMFFNGKLTVTDRFTDFNSMQSAVGNYMASASSAGDCTDVNIGAVAAALQNNLNLKSPVYVITDSTPSDLSQADNAAYLSSIWRSPLTWFFIGDSQQCSPSPEDNAYRGMDDLVKRTGGITYYVQNQTMLYSLSYNHFWSTLYRSQLLLSNDLLVCSNQEIFQSVSIDIAVQQLSIIATGVNLKLIVTSPDGSHPDAVQAYNDGSNFIWSFNGPHSGNWFFSVITTTGPTDPCSFKVFQKSYHNVAALNQPQYDLFWTFSSEQDIDSSWMQPIYGFAQGVSMHLTNYPYKNPQQVQAGLSIYTNRKGTPKQVYASNGIWRDGCSYNFYFPPFSCQYPNERLYFNFFARDNLGSAIQRAGNMYCEYINITPEPPNGCLNGGVPNSANTTCFCPMGYNGTYCQTVTCFNGGTPQGSKCGCLPGWTGSFCELAVCLEQGPNPEITHTGVDMVFAVELTSQGWAQLQSLNQVFAELLRDITSQDGQWLRDYVLIGFNSTWGDVIATAPASNPNSVVTALSNLASSIPTDTGCTVQLYRALMKTIERRDAPPGSYVEIFITSKPNAGDMRDWVRTYHDARMNVITFNSFIAYSPRQNGFFCNATQADFTYLYDLSAGTNGQVFNIQPAVVAEIVKTIPLQYENGIVYSAQAMDCSSQPLLMYFPVDSYAQTIQIYTQGFGKTISVFDPNGVQQQSTLLADDSYSGITIAELRKPCGEDWLPVGQYCMHFSIDTLSFWDAQNFCHSNNAFLVDDLTQNKHDYLTGAAHSIDFWIGLSLGNDSQWYWDRSGGSPPQPLVANETQFWAGGGSAPTDPSKGCVYFSSNVADQNTWVPDVCTVTRHYACQRHAYDIDHAPDSNTVLAPGKWSVQISTNSTANNLGCGGQIRLQSELQVNSGFSLTTSSDIPTPDPVNDSPNNMVMTYVHSHDNNFQTPILTHAYINNVNGSFYNGLQYLYRFGCSFPWLSQPFPCPVGQEIAITHIGEDALGYNFQRVTLGHCSSEVITCGNGGLRYNGTCVCTEYWTGSQCTVPICVNGGTPDPDNQRCLCPNGFAGNSCQYDKCTQQIPDRFTPNSRSLAVIVEHTQQNLPAIKQLISNFTSIVTAATAQEPTWFLNFPLYLFDGSGLIMASNSLTPQDLVSHLASSITGTLDPGTCDLPIFKTISTALSYQNYINEPNSEILLVTAAGASDADYATRILAVEQVANLESMLHYLYLQTSTCGETPTMNSLSHLVNLAFFSGGTSAFLPMANLNEFLYAYLPTRYAASTLSSATAHLNYTCDGSSDFYVEVDKNVTTLYITVASQFGSVTVMTPKYDRIVPNVLFNRNTQKLYSLDVTNMPGFYKFSLSSPGSCYMNIYSQGGALVHKHFIAPSMTDPSGAHTDGSLSSPLAGMSNVGAFHLIGSPGHRGKLTHVDYYDVSSQTTFQSQLYPRFGCTFEYYSDPFVCGNDFLAVFINGVDENNQPFRRETMAMCLNGTLPTINPPASTSSGTTIMGQSTMKTSPGMTSGSPVTSPTTIIGQSTMKTSPGGMTSGSPVTSPTMGPTTAPAPVYQIDLVFLLDVTSSANNTFADMQTFVMNLVSSYQLGTAAHVAIIPVFGVSGSGPGAVAPLNGIGSMDVLQQTLKQTQLYYNDFGTVGQALEDGIMTASSVSFTAPNNGYRTNISNHLIIYVTSNTAFTGPTPDTSATLSSGQYGFIGIGYQGGNATALTSLSGGSNCVFTANDAKSLSTSVVSGVNHLIHIASTNGGKYCGM